MSRKENWWWNGGGIVRRCLKPKAYFHQDLNIPFFTLINTNLENLIPTISQTNIRNTSSKTSLKTLSGSCIAGILSLTDLEWFSFVFSIRSSSLSFAVLHASHLQSLASSLILIQFDRSGLHSLSVRLCLPQSSWSEQVLEQELHSLQKLKNNFQLTKKNLVMTLTLMLNHQHYDFDRRLRSWQACTPHIDKVSLVFLFLYNLGCRVRTCIEIFLANHSSEFANKFGDICSTLAIVPRQGMYTRKNKNLPNCNSCWDNCSHHSADFDLAFESIVVCMNHKTVFSGTHQEIVRKTSFGCRFWFLLGNSLVFAVLVFRYTLVESQSS